MVFDLIIGLVESFKSTLENDKFLVGQSSVHQLGVELGTGQYWLEGSRIGLACTDEANALDELLVHEAIEK